MLLIPLLFILHVLNFLIITLKQQLLQNVKNQSNFICIMVLFILIFVIILVSKLQFPCLLKLLTYLILLLYHVNLLRFRIIFIIIIIMGECKVSLRGYVSHDILYDFYGLFILIIKELGLDLLSLFDGK
jgi:hypothetical protein